MYDFPIKDNEFDPVNVEVTAPDFVGDYPMPTASQFDLDKNPDNADARNELFGFGIAAALAANMITEREPSIFRGVDNEPVALNVTPDEGGFFFEVVPKKDWLV